MSTTQSDDTELREKLKALKPHTDDQLPLGDLLSVKETDAVMSLFNLYATKRETAVLERKGVYVVNSPKYADLLNEDHYDTLTRLRIDNGKIVYDTDYISQPLEDRIQMYEERVIGHLLKKKRDTALQATLEKEL